MESGKKRRPASRGAARNAISSSALASKSVWRAQVTLADWAGRQAPSAANGIYFATPFQSPTCPTLASSPAKRPRLTSCPISFSIGRRQSRMADGRAAIGARQTINLRARPAYRGGPSWTPEGGGRRSLVESAFAVDSAVHLSVGRARRPFLQRHPFPDDLHARSRVQLF